MHSKEQIQMIAENLLPGFLPKDPATTTLVFHFTIPPRSSYKVTFEKNTKEEWIFKGYLEDGPQ